MPARKGTAHVVTTTRTYKDRVYRTHLLRRSYREGGTVKNETLGNLSHLPDALIEIIRRSLQGEHFVPLAQVFEISRSRPHGHVQAIALTLQRLGLAALLAGKPCRERDLVLAMVAARIVAPHPKLATTRWWHTTTLAEDFGVDGCDEDDLYAAMDWLLARQDRIQKKLAARHLRAGGLVLYDLSSSYFEGTTCPLAKLGYSRDGRKGLLQVNYGLLTDARGCPVAVAVHEGNVSDSQTLMPEIKRLRKDFGIERLVMVGDRGMISSQAIDEMREAEEFLVVAPTEDRRHRICAGDEIEVCVGPSLLEVAQGVDRVCRAIAVEVHAACREAWVRGSRDHGHQVAVFCLRNITVGLLPRLAGRHEDNFIEVEPRLHFARSHEVTVVDGIESAAHDPNTEATICHQPCSRPLPNISRPSMRSRRIASAAPPNT